ncbi:hypothetical protein HMPREF3188_00936 [Tissierellia bacterium KA00581]|nr:hypothetical protein HMPREF3188_00936 [Tissierellia bacterium KA00581]
MTFTFFKILSYLSFIIYFVFCFFSVSLFHLKEDVKAIFFRSLFMPVLMIFYFSSFKNHILTVYFALLFSWFGDMFLSRLNVKNIFLSFLFYSISVILFLLNILLKINFKNLNYILVSFVFLFYLIIAFVYVFLTMERTRKVLKGNNIFTIFRTVLALFCIFVIIFASETKGKFLYLILGSNLLFVNQLLFSHYLITKKNEFLDFCLTITYSLSLLFLVCGFGKMI